MAAIPMRKMAGAHVKERADAMLGCGGLKSSKVETRFFQGFGSPQPKWKLDLRPMPRKRS
jgi:hypothetical protein